MRAISITEHGLQLVDRPVPEPTKHQILVKVKFAALNRADLAMAQGNRHGSAGGEGAIAGLECSGEVVSIGSEVQGFAVGDPVMCSGAGAYAEFMLTDLSRCQPIPGFNDGVYDFMSAATLPVALQTMHDAIATQGQLSPGQSVLIQGASSGVGILGMQIARVLGASEVWGSSTHQERRARLLDYGADQVVDTKDPDWSKLVQQGTQQQGVDLLVDQISGYVANENMRATAIGGRIVNVGRLGGMQADFNFDLHALRRINYIGVTFRTRSRSEVAAINQAMWRDLGAALHEGKFTVPVDCVFALDEVVAAQSYMAENQHFGKILLSVNP